MYAKSESRPTGYTPGIVYALLRAFFRHGKRICSDNTGRGTASWDILCKALSAQDKGLNGHQL
jgi:hypothetical protein